MSTTPESATPVVKPPLAPTAVTAVVHTGDRLGTAVDISWEAPLSVGGVALDGYRVDVDVVDSFDSGANLQPLISETVSVGAYPIQHTVHDLTPGEILFSGCCHK